MSNVATKKTNGTKTKKRGKRGVEPSTVSERATEIGKALDLLSSDVAELVGELPPDLGEPGSAGGDAIERMTKRIANLRETVAYMHVDARDARVALGEDERAETWSES